jgi:hypothetical protein
MVKEVRKKNHFLFLLEMIPYLSTISINNLQQLS